MPDAPAGGGAAAPPVAPAPVITSGGSGGAAPPPIAPETPAIQTPTPETPDKFEFKFEGDDEVYPYEDKPEASADSDATYDASKPFDPKIEAALKDNPEGLKAVKQAHYELRQYKAAGFKTPAEAKAFREGVESLGGLEAVTKDAGITKERLAQLHNGDDASLEWLMQEHAEGMTKLASGYLGRLAKSSPNVYAREMGKVFMATLRTAGDQGVSPLAAFNSLYDLESVKGDPQAQKLLKQIADTINAVDGAAKGSAEDAGGGKLNEREQALKVQEHTVYLKDVNIRANPLVSSAAEQALSVAFKGLKISKESRAELLKDIKGTFNQLQKQDEVFQKNANDLLRARDTDKFLRVLKSAIQRNMARAALREARKYKGLSGDTATRKAESQARVESSAGSVAATARVKYSGPMRQGGPDPSVIDYAQMRSQYGRKGTDEMLGRREFLKKGDPKTVFFW